MGNHADKINDETTDYLAQRWQTDIEAVTGVASYEEMCASLRQTNTERFPDVAP